MNKKISIPQKPQRNKNANSIDNWVTGEGEGNKNSPAKKSPNKTELPASSLQKPNKKSPTRSHAPKKTDTTKNSKTPKTPEDTKRLTLDIPETLHRKIKTACVSKGESMADVLREILEERF